MYAPLLQFPSVDDVFARARCDSGSSDAALELRRLLALLNLVLLNSGDFISPQVLHCSSLLGRIAPSIEQPGNHLYNVTSTGAPSELPDLCVDRFARGCHVEDVRSCWYGFIEI